jgi:hypothetical protein
MDTDRLLRHDARNFLNAMRLNLQALELADKAEDQLECLEGIERAADEAVGWVARFESHQSTAGAGQP